MGGGMGWMGLFLIIVLFAIGIAIMRWAFRINTIIEHLSNIVDCLLDVVDILEERPKRQKPKDKTTK